MYCGCHGAKTGACKSEPRAFEEASGDNGRRGSPGAEYDHVDSQAHSFNAISGRFAEREDRQNRTRDI